MSIGMTYDEYWYGDCYLTRVYYEKNRIDIKRRNEEMWLQGLYINNAVTVAINTFFGKSKSVKYLEKPLDILPKTKEEKEQEEKEYLEKVVRFLNGLDKRSKGGTKNA